MGMEKHYSNQDILSEFMLHLELAGRSEETLKSYSKILKRFLRDVPTPIQELTPDAVYEWLKAKGEGKQESTLSNWISTLSSFFTFCKEEEYIERIPIKSRWRPRLPKPIPKYLEQKELAKVRMVLESGILRNQVLFEFLVSSGCRISEGIRLDKKDINLEERTATVEGKGRKIRTVHFSNRCAILLEKHLSLLPEGSEAIFLTKKGDRLSPTYAYEIFNKAGKQAGMETSFGPHRLRHTFATTLLSKGADLAFISEELGHSQLSTTQVYARLPQQQLASMYRKFMG